MTLAATLGIAGAASAAPDDSAHRAVIPDSKISVQLFNFFSYIGFGSDAAAQERLDSVLGFLAAQGYPNVEAYDYTAFQGVGAEGFAAMLNSHGLKASGMHTSLTMDTTDEQWEAALEVAKTIGAPYIGAGATPRTFTTEAEWIAYAEKIDHFGEMARQQGLHYIVHSHNWEFAPVGDTTGYDILQAHTDPRNVDFELDLYWVTAAGADPFEVIEAYGDRIHLLHVKDMDQNGSITTVGTGTIDFPPLFTAAGKGVKYYVVERDPIYSDPTFDPFTPAAAGIDYLQEVRF